MRHHPPALGQHRPRPIHILRRQLLEYRVLEPQEDVPPPQTLVGGGRHVGDRALVNLAAAVVVGRRLNRGLLEARVVEPRVVRERLVPHRLLVLKALLADHHALDPVPIAVRLFELHELLVQLLSLREGGGARRHSRAISASSRCQLYLIRTRCAPAISAAARAHTDRSRARGPPPSRAPQRRRRP